MPLFRLVDPPNGQRQIVADALTAIDYPWWRLQPALRRDPDGAVLVRWLDTGQQTTGQFFGDTYEIHLGTRYSGWQDKVPFVLVHEVGHLVDRATLDGNDRHAIRDLCHLTPGRFDGQQLNGETHPWSHEQPHSDLWISARDPYQFRAGESYADLFVAAFAPDIWHGHHERFVHWTDDLDTVRELTLRRRLMPFADVPEDGAHAEAMEKAAAAGVIEGYGDGTFGPSRPVLRGQLASILDSLGLLDPEPI